jgi:hypothetical protein
MPNAPFKTGGALDLKPTAGQCLKGDIGILRGNGFQTLQRVYGANKASSITAGPAQRSRVNAEAVGPLGVSSEFTLIGSSRNSGKRSDACRAMPDHYRGKEHPVPSARRAPQGGEPPRVR